MRCLGLSFMAFLLIPGLAAAEGGPSIAVVTRSMGATAVRAEARCFSASASLLGVPCGNLYASPLIVPQQAPAPHHWFLYSCEQLTCSSVSTLTPTTGAIVLRNLKRGRTYFLSVSYEVRQLSGFPLLGRTAFAP